MLEGRGRADIAGSVVLGLGDKVVFVESFAAVVDEGGPAIEDRFAAVVVALEPGVVLVAVVNGVRGADVDAAKLDRPEVVAVGFLIDVVPLARAEAEGIDLVCDVLPTRLARVE